ncbi:MAG: hypothetical protein II975_00810 [Bacteroidales bacterium]|nr:hypothetical protein [Bacteroidales bacterium]
MKKLLLFVFLLTSAAVIDAQVTKKVAVWDTKCGDNSIKPFQGTMVRGGIETAVGNTPGYEVFDRSAFDIILKEHNFERSGVMSDAEINEMGKLAGVKYVVVPEASVNGDEFYVLVKMLDVETGKVGLVYDAFCTATGQNIHNTCKELGEKMFGDRSSNSKKNGTLTLDEGKYVGEILNGKPHGHGKMSYNPNDSKNRVSFEGEWISGVRVKGKLIWKNNSWYDGEMNEKGRNGQGTELYANGSKYVGSWVDDEPNGYGVKYNSKGRVVYEGMIKDGDAHGLGTCYLADGRRYEGTFKAGKAHGFGVMYSEEGKKIYMGEYKDNNSNGLGAGYKDDGSTLFGTYVDGKREGKFLKISKNGKSEVVTFSNGEQVTEWY